MKIKISNLSLGSHEMIFQGESKELKLDSPFCGKFWIKVDVDKSNHQIVLSVDGKLECHLDCDRCASEYDAPIEFTYKMVYLLDAPIKGVDDINVKYITPEVVTIDISEDIYDFALLSIPIKKLCNEDCKGLCVKCGSNLNTENCPCPEEEDNSNKPFARLKDILNNN